MKTREQGSSLLIEREPFSLFEFYFGNCRPDTTPRGRGGRKSHASIECRDDSRDVGRKETPP